MPLCLSTFASSVLILDCLLCPLNTTFHPLCHLQLISTNNDGNSALVQLYKLTIHTTMVWTGYTHNHRLIHRLQRTLRCCKWLSPVWMRVWVMIHGCTEKATYQPEDRQRHCKSSSVIFTLSLTHQHPIHAQTHKPLNIHFSGLCVLECVFIVPGGTPVEMVEEVTTPRPAAVRAATCNAYMVVVVRPVSWYCRVELDSERSSRLDSTPNTSHRSS